MKSSLFALALIAAPFAFAGAPPPSVPDTVCPADVSQLILGAPWAFQLHAGEYGPSGSAAVGTFTARPGGTLTATMTAANIGVIYRRAEASGRYILYPDCSGGEIMVMFGGFSFQLEFVWSNGFTQMLFVTDELNTRYNGSMVLTGNARRAPTGCPAGLGNPLNILNATTWSFRLSQAYYRGGGTSSVGTFKPFVSGQLGLLSGIETSIASSFGPVYRRMQESGRYLIYADCSGGEIMLMNRQPGSLQLEFVFVGAGFDEMFMLTDDATYTPDTPLGGQAFRY